ncbi:MAG: NUDIX hydrolase [Paracoccaceae bacterium]
MIKQLPLSLGRQHKKEVRSQFAALCYKVQNDKVRVLLVTSRRTGRWIIPKGWPMDGKTPAETAAQEAWEEAGVQGKVRDMCLGLFSYRKVLEDADDLPCVAMVYPVKVKSLATIFPETGQRKRKWVSRKKAAQMVSEPELARILRDFDPRLL